MPDVQLISKQFYKVFYAKLWCSSHQFIRLTSKPGESRNFFSVCSIDVAEEPHKQLEAKAYYYGMTIAPMAYLTLNIVYKSDSLT